MNRPSKPIKINVREKNTPAQRKLPKSIVSFFSAAQLSFGLNHGFIKPTSKKYKYALNFLMIFVAFVIPIIQLLYFKGIKMLWAIIFIIYYLPNLIILFFSTSTLCEFLTDMMIMLEVEFKDSSVNNVGPVAWLYITLLFLMKLVHFLLVSSSFINFILEIAFIALDITPIAKFVVFYLVSVSITNLRIEVGREISAKRFYTTYKAIADMFEMFRTSYDAVVSIVLKTPRFYLFEWVLFNS